MRLFFCLILVASSGCKPDIGKLTEEGKSLYFVDSAGARRLLSSDFDGRHGLGLRRLGDWRPQLSTDGRHAAFLESNGALMLARTDGTMTVMVSSPTERIPNSKVFIHNIIGGWAKDNSQLFFARVAWGSESGVIDGNLPKEKAGGHMWAYDLKENAAIELSSVNSYLPIQAEQK